MKRPWYLFDYVDPAPKFRRIPEGTSTSKVYLSEGDDDAQLTDTPPIEEESKPVYVHHYK